MSDSIHENNFSFEFKKYTVVSQSQAIPSERYLHFPSSKLNSKWIDSKVTIKQLLNHLLHVSRQALVLSFGRRREYDASHF